MSARKLPALAIPEPVQQIGAALQAAGARCWLVGGAVRDALLGLPLGDLDLATDLPPARVATALGQQAGHQGRYGAFELPCGDHRLTLTTLRAETGYQDHRHPDRVEFVTDVAVDARRRDFTCNAIYVDLGSREWLDPVGGIEAVARRELAMIGDAAVRLVEDPLRQLRAVRFWSSRELTPAPTLHEALRNHAGELRHLRPERTLAELSAMFTGPGRGTALRRFVALGQAAVLLPEVAAMDGVTQPPQYHPEGDVLTHVALVLDHVEPGRPVQSWAAVLHDVGKPPTWRQAEDRIRFDGHDELSATMAEAILERLQAPADLRRRVVAICREHIHFASLPQMRPRRRERWLRDPDFPEHLAFHRADCLGSHGDLSIHETAAAALAALPPQPLALVTGADVKALGVPEGPMVGELLRAVEAEMQDHPAPGRELALSRLRDLLATRVKPAAPPVDNTVDQRRPPR